MNSAKNNAQLVCSESNDQLYMLSPVGLIHAYRSWYFLRAGHPLFAYFLRLNLIPLWTQSFPAMVYRLDFLSSHRSSGIHS